MVDIESREESSMETRKKVSTKIYWALNLCEAYGLGTLKGRIITGLSTKGWHIFFFSVKHQLIHVLGMWGTWSQSQLPSSTSAAGKQLWTVCKRRNVAVF